MSLPRANKKKVDQPEAKVDQPEAKIDQPEAKVDQPRAKSRPESHFWIPKKDNLVWVL